MSRYRGKGFAAVFCGTGSSFLRNEPNKQGDGSCYMKIPRSFFLVYCLFLTNLWMLGYASFVRHFQSGQEMKHHIGILKSQVSRSQFEKRVLDHQLLDLQQTVAEVLPNLQTMIAKQWSSRALGLSDRLRKPASIKPVNLSDFYFEKGKKYFSEGKFKSAQKEFLRVQEQFPTSDRVVESTFLILESAFLQKDYKRTVDVAESMVQQFPVNLLTGYALIRLAQVSEINNQFEEAAVLYKIVRENFQDKKLQSQARALEKRIGIE